MSFCSKNFQWLPESCIFNVGDKTSDKQTSMITCFSAFLLCFCDGEMTLPAGMVGDGQPDWGEDGCDGLDDTRGKNDNEKLRYQS